MIDEVLPENENEVIRVVGYDRHLQYFIRLLSDYAKRNLRRNYRLCTKPSDLWGTKKVIVLNGGNFRSGYKMIEDLSMMEKDGRKVIRVWDRQLEAELIK